MSILKWLGGGSESETPRDGILSSRAEWHSFGLGLAVGVHVHQRLGADHAVLPRCSRAMSDEGLLCPGCRETHDDYEKLGKRTIDGPHHRGYAHIYECGRCGERTEVLTS